MPSVTITLGERALTINAALQPGQVITVDALGRGFLWHGGMRAATPLEITGGQLRLAPGRNDLEIKLKEPGDYAGDLRVRVCRTWPLAP